MEKSMYIDAWKRIAVLCVGLANTYIKFGIIYSFIILIFINVEEISREISHVARQLENF